MTNILPAGWKWEKMEEILTLIQNGINVSQNEDGFGYPISRIETIQNEKFDPNRIKYAIIKKDKVQKYRYKKGDIVFSHINSYEILGKVAIFNNDIKNLIHGVNLLRFQFVNSVFPKYAFYYFKTNICRSFYKKYINRAINQASINQKNLKKTPFPLPPLPEQKRIVTKLDEIFENTDKAIAKVEENIKYIEDLWQSVLSEVFDEGKEKWEKLELSEMLEKKIILSHLDGNHGSLYPRKSEFVAKGVPYIGANSLLKGSVNFTKAKFLPEIRAKKFKKGVAKSGDVLFAHNATVGPVAILRTELEYVILSTSVTYYRCNLEILLPDFLFFYMQSLPFINQYQMVMKQATRNQVPITKQRTFVFVLAPLPEQKKIVSYLNNVSEQIEKLKTEQTTKLENLKDLKASVLDSAFKGKI